MGSLWGCGGVAVGLRAIAGLTRNAFWLNWVNVRLKFVVVGLRGLRWGRGGRGGVAVGLRWGCGGVAVGLRWGCGGVAAQIPGLPRKIFWLNWLDFWLNWVVVRWRWGRGWSRWGCGGVAVGSRWGCGGVAGACAVAVGLWPASVMTARRPVLAGVGRPCILLLDARYRMRVVVRWSMHGYVGPCIC